MRAPRIRSLWEPGKRSLYRKQRVVFIRVLKTFTNRQTCSEETAPSAVSSSCGDHWGLVHSQRFGHIVYVLSLKQWVVSSCLR